MLLPGPEALQLAIYLGWKLHGIRGGLVAGLGFIRRAIVLLLGLSWLYARFGSVPAATGVLLGLKAAVLALVLQALLRVGRRALVTRLHVGLRSPRSWRSSGCACRSRRSCSRPGSSASPSAWRAPRPQPPCSAVAQRRGADPGRSHRPLLWLAPLLVVAATLGPQSLWSRLYLFFTQAALVTFGGAYAVLGYVTEHLVHDLGWLTAQQSVAGLALAETTPGPLVIVLQFMGFMAGWNQPGAAFRGGGRGARGAARVVGDVPAVVRVHLPRARRTSSA